jgi:tRNA pseudouridine38-40 synthase
MNNNDNTANSEPDEKHNPKPYRLKMHVAYDGSDFCGWQKQTAEDALSSIQETLETAFYKLFKVPISCVASGRTDAGVHALAQVVHCDIPMEPRRIVLTKALKSFLPSTVSVKRVWEAPKDFHSLYSATAKTYRYVVHTGPTPPAILGRFCLWYPYRFDLERLNKIAKLLEGTHDFKSFQSRGTPVASTERTIFKAEWAQKSKYLYHFEITGSGFLKQMVRNIIGTQLLFCKDRLEPEQILELLEAKDRQAAGWTASPQGLFLLRVYYPVELDKKCLRL